MTSASTIPSSSTPAEAHPTPTGGPATGGPATGGTAVRLEMKSEAKPTGYVDGGWWPRSRSLADELPGLVEALTPRLGPVEWVSYHLGEWQSPPSAVEVEGGSVRLGGYRLQGAGSLDVIARDKRVTLLVVDPEQSDKVAGAALSASAVDGNDDDVATLIAHATEAT